MSCIAILIPLSLTDQFSYQHITEECLDAWSDLNGKKPSSPHDQEVQEVLNETDNLEQQTSLCRQKVYVQKDFLRISDLVLLDFLTLLSSPDQRFFLLSIVNSIPSEWCALAKASSNVSFKSAPIPSIPTIKTERQFNSNFRCLFETDY